MRRFLEGDAVPWSDDFAALEAFSVGFAFFRPGNFGGLGKSTERVSEDVSVELVDVSCEFVSVASTSTNLRLRRLAGQSGMSPTSESVSVSDGLRTADGRAGRFLPSNSRAGFWLFAGPAEVGDVFSAATCEGLIARPERVRDSKTSVR